jgi:hypothetical protein
MKMVLLKIFICFVLAIIIAGYLLFKYEPILLKFLDGTARNLGTPIHATVYTNGRPDTSIKVYRIGKYWDGIGTNDFLLELSEFDSEGMLKFINVDLKEKWVGRPVCTSEDCYKVISGRLFQSETGGKFVPFEDDMKGYDFNPQLTVSYRQFSFNIPPNLLRFETVRIEY